MELLNLLDKLSESVDSQGQLSAAGKELQQIHFNGEKAWFSSDSEGSKRDFGKGMTFPDPADSSRSIQCFWHGEIKTPQFRVHFEWPLSIGTKRIKVTYIGPKISKK